MSPATDRRTLTANTLRPRAGAQSFVELLGRVKATVQGALAHADVPFQQIVSDLNVPRNAAYSPVFQTMFALEDNMFESQDAAADKAEPIEVRMSTSFFRGIVLKLVTCSRFAKFPCCLPHFWLADRGLQTSHKNSVSFPF